MAPTGWTRANLIPNAPLRGAYLCCGLTVSEVCLRLGWCPRRDTTRLHRRLGLMSQKDSKRRGARPRVQQNIDRLMAVEICRAIGVDFDEVYEGVALPESSAGRCSCGVPMIWPAERCGFCESPVDRAERAMWQEAA